MDARGSAGRCHLLEAILVEDGDVEQLVEEEVDRLTEVVERLVHAVDEVEQQNFGALTHRHLVVVFHFYGVLEKLERVDLGAAGRGSVVGDCNGALVRPRVRFGDCGLMLEGCGLWGGDKS